MFAFVVLKVIVLFWNQTNASIINACPNDTQRYTDRRTILSIENYSYGVLNKEKLEGIESALPELQSLIIRNDSISSIEAKTFGSLKYLNCLDLSSNNLSSFDASTFFGLIRLTILILSKNHVKEIPIDSSPFYYLENLEVLDLSYNNIHTLTPTSFQGMTKLNYLNLQKNELKEISREIFNFLPSLIELNLSDNPLEILDVSNSKTLTALSVTSTKLQLLPWMSQNLKILDIQNCNLTEIHDYELLMLSRLDKVYLRGNPWKCTCKLILFSVWLNSSSTAVNGNRLECADPIYMLKNFVTDINKNCLLNDSSRSFLLDTLKNSHRQENETTSNYVSPTTNKFQLEHATNDQTQKLIIFDNRRKEQKLSTITVAKNHYVVQIKFGYNTSAGNETSSVTLEATSNKTNTTRHLFPTVNGEANIRLLPLFTIPVTFLVGLSLFVIWILCRCRSRLRKRRQFVPPHLETNSSSTISDNVNNMNSVD